MEYRDVQLIAKNTMNYIKSIVKVGMSLTEIREKCEQKMLELGAESFWYWDVGAFVFSNNQTTVSISGKHYKTPDSIVNSNDIITIDLSSQYENIWGDYARTIIIENGVVINNINDIKNPEWKKGLQIEEKLHKELLCYVTPSTTFEELYFYMNSLITSNGFINLDFIGNLGHSIVKQKSDRIYIEKGNKYKLSDVKYFTFEPHISLNNSDYGFKKENIYYFKNNRLMEL